MLRLDPHTEHGGMQLASVDEVSNQLQGESG